MSKHLIMKYAHQIARAIVHATENYAIALKMALKYVWYAVKTWNKKRFSKQNLVASIHYLTASKKQIEAKKYTDGIPNWILRKNLTQSEYEAVNCDGSAPSIVKETEKAIDFKFNTDFGVIYMWCPKSVYREDLVF